MTNFMGINRGLVALTLLGAMVIASSGAEHYDELDNQRIRQIEALVPAQPAGFGRPIMDRAFWSSTMPHEAASNVVAEAAALAGGCAYTSQISCLYCA